MPNIVEGNILIEGFDKEIELLYLEEVLFDLQKLDDLIEFYNEVVYTETADLYEITIGLLRNHLQISKDNYEQRYDKKFIYKDAIRLLPRYGEDVIKKGRESRNTVKNTSIIKP